MFNWRKEETKPKAEKKPAYWDVNMENGDASAMYANTIAEIHQAHKALEASASGAAMDSSAVSSAAKVLAMPPTSISTQLANWYASQSFIGYQLCAILSQHWLIAKACAMPARDATRNGYDVVTTDGSEISNETVKVLQKYDKQYRVRWNAEQLVSMGRIFGLRIALFDVESTDPEYYEKPFNPDGVAKGSYKGISQIDPYWCVPELVGSELNNPASRHFYEPTYWNINGKKYHRSHLIIFRNDEVPDLLKPVYLYGGKPVPQLIMERVYGAERSAGEAPLLVQSKRTNVWLTNLEKFIAKGDEGIRRLTDWIRFRDNHGIKLGSKDDDAFQQFDTSLTDLDEVIMTQYQLVAAASGVPATKLLGTTPKGFNSTGEYEDTSYHETLESIQAHDLTELVERHHLLTMLSFGDEVVNTTVHWKPTDSPTAAQLAERNKLKADTYMSLVQAGAIDSQDVRGVISKDPDFGFGDMGLGTSDGDEMLKDLGFSETELDAAHEIGLTDEAKE